MRPMLATRGGAAPGAIPRGDGWVHEVKWDGMRVLAVLRDGGARLLSRTERDVSVSFPELASLGALHDDLVLDGEVVRMVDGIPSFHGLGERMHVANAAIAQRLAASSPVIYVVFDVLRVDGLDITPLPWSARRAALESLVVKGDHWQVPDVHDDGIALWHATAEQGLEGTIAKRRDAPYRPGVRSDAWLKFPHRATESVVIGGWRAQTGTETRLGSLLVGLPAPDGGLRFAGRVGSGLAGAAGAALLPRLIPYAADDSPFIDPLPRVDAQGAHWLRPELVIDVASLGRGGQGRLRQPSYQGLRADLTPLEILDVLDGGA